NPDDAALGRELDRLAEAAREQAVQPRRRAPQTTPAPAGKTARTAAVPQDIRFCTTADNVGIAYAVTGEGYPVIKAANWMSHLHYDRESPVWRHWVDGLSASKWLIRYDERGNGLSDWNVSDLSMEAMLAD